MHGIKLLFTIFLVLLSSVSLADDSEKKNTFDINIEQKVLKKLLYSKVVIAEQMAQNPHIVQAVLDQNQKNIPIFIIKGRDNEWISTKTTNKLKQQVTENPIAIHFKHLVEFESHLYSEIFLTDNQGVTLAAYPLTSDYWQGDEDKWSVSYNNGDGKIHIGDFEFDESSGTNAIQISVPVWDEKRTIGVLVVGIKLTHFQAQYLKKTWGIQPNEFSP